MSIMEKLGEGKDQLVRYMECAVEIQEGSETSAAGKVKSDAQTFIKTNNSKLIELKCTFIMVKVEINSLDEYSNTKTMSEKEFFAPESLGCEPFLLTPQY